MLQILLDFAHITLFEYFSQENQPKGVEIVPDFQASVDLAENFIRTGEIETVWIMGGQRIYTVRNSIDNKINTLSILIQQEVSHKT